MAPVGPWAQPNTTRREGWRRAERPVGSYATPDTPCSRTASEGSLLTERDQTVPALRPKLDDPNLFGSSNRSATAGRSPRPREAEGRLAPEMAESHEARSQAQAQRRAWPQCIATWAASGVAVPRAFFGTFFRFERKYFPPRGGSPTARAVIGASIPRRGFSDGRLISDRHKQGAFRSPPAPLRFAYPSKAAPHKAAPVLPHRSRCAIPSARR